MLPGETELGECDPGDRNQREELEVGDEVLEQAGQLRSADIDQGDGEQEGLGQNPLKKSNHL